MAEDTSLFSISCDTCAARLKVRDESAIGQVLACPKCGSMLMVDPPEGWVPPVKTPPAPRPKRLRDPNDSQSTLSGEFSDLNDPTIATKSAPRRTPITTPATAAPRISTAADSRPVLPDGSWESAAAQGRSKRIAWISGIGGLCLVALVAIVYLITSMAGGTSRVADGDPANVGDVATDQPKSDQPGNEKGSGASDSPGDNADSKDESDSTSPDSPAAESGSNPGNADDGDAPDNSPDPGDNNPSDNDSVSDPPPTHPADSGDPLIDVDNSLAPPANSLLPDEADSGSTLMDNVGELGDLFSDPGVSEVIRDIASDSDGMIGIGKVYVPIPDELEFDFDRQLAETFPGISFENIPLIEFLRHLNVLTNIPIQLDDHSVTFGRIDPLARVTFKGTNQSVIAIINNVVADQDLVAVAVPEDRVIILIDKNQTVFTERKFPLNPALIGDDASNAELMALVRLITGPGFWNTDGGQARIEIVGNEAVVESDGRLADEASLILRKLGAAAVVNDDPQKPEAAAELQTVWAATLETLESPDAFEENQLDSIHHILNQVQHADTLVVSVDWRSVMKEKWNPSTQIPWPSRDLTVGETLGDIVSSMGLATRLLSPGVMEMTSKDNCHDATRIEVYPCQKQLKKFSSEQIMIYLRSSVESGLGGVDSSWKRVEFVPRFNCVIARLPDPLQLKIEKTLTELGRD